MPEVARLSAVVELDSTAATASAKRFEDQFQQTSDSVKEGFVVGAGMAAFTLALGAIEKGLGAVKAAAFDMNSSLETSTLQFSTLMGSADEARAHVAGLFEYAKQTPFETGPIIEASRMLETFGGAALDTMDNVKMLGDASAATQAPIEELGFWVGRLYSSLQGGQPFGEAAMRLQELAVMSPQARAQMEAMQKAGADADDIFKVFTEDLKRFTGATLLQAKTWAGLVSTFTDSLNMMGAETFKPIFDLAKEALAGLVDLLDSATTKGAIKAFADGLTAIIYAAREVWAAIQPAISGVIAWVGAITGLDQLFASLGSTASDTAEAAKRVDRAAALPQGNAGLKQADASAKALAGSVKSAQSAVEAIDDQLSDVDKQLGGLKRQAEDITKAYDDQIKPLEDQIDQLTKQRDYLTEMKGLQYDLIDLDIRRAEQQARGDPVRRAQLEGLNHELDVARQLIDLEQKRADILYKIRYPDGTPEEQALKAMRAEDKQLAIADQRKSIEEQLSKAKTPQERESAQRAAEAFNRRQQEAELEAKIDAQKAEREKESAVRQKDKDILELASLSRQQELLQLEDSRELTQLSMAQAANTAAKDALDYETQRTKLVNEIAALPLVEQAEKLARLRDEELAPLKEQEQVLTRQRDLLQTMKKDAQDALQAVKEQLAAVKEQQDALKDTPQASAKKPPTDVEGLLADAEAQKAAATKRGQELGQALIDGFWTWIDDSVATAPARFGAWILKQVEAIDWAGIWASLTAENLAFWVNVAIGSPFAAWLRGELEGIDWKTQVFAPITAATLAFWANVTTLGAAFATWLAAELATINWKTDVWDHVTRFADDTTAWIKEQWPQVDWQAAIGKNDVAGQNMGDAIATWIASVKWETIGQVAADALIRAVGAKMAYDQQKQNYDAATGAFVLGLGKSLVNINVQWTVAVVRLIEEFLAELNRQLNIDETWRSVTATIRTQLGLAVNEAVKGGVSVTEWLGIGANIIAGIWKGITDSVGSFVTNLTTWVTDNIITPIKTALGIQSPSTVMATIGTELVNGLAQGITTALTAGTLQTALLAIQTTIMQTMSGPAGGEDPTGGDATFIWAKQLGLDIIGGLVAGLMYAWTTAAPGAAGPDQAVIGLQQWFINLATAINEAINLGFMTIAQEAGVTDVEGKTGAQVGLYVIGTQLLEGLLAGLNYAWTTSVAGAQGADQSAIGLYQWFVNLGTAINAAINEGFLLVAQAAGIDTAAQEGKTGAQLGLYAIGTQLLEGLLAGLNYAWTTSVVGATGPDDAVIGLYQWFVNLGTAIESAVQEGFMLVATAAGTVVAEGKTGAQLGFVHIGAQLFEGLMAGLNYAWTTEATGAASPDGKAIGVYQWFVNLAQAIVTAVDTGFAAISEATDQAAGDSGAADAQSAASTALYQTGWDLLSGLWDGAIDEWLEQEVWWRLLPLLIGEAVRMNIMTMNEAGRAVMKGFTDGVKQEWESGDGLTFWKELGMKIKQAVESWPPRTLLQQPAKELMEGMLEEVKKGADEILKTIKDLGKQVVEALKEVTKAFEEAAKIAEQAAGQIEAAAQRAEQAAGRILSAAMMASSASGGGFGGGGAIGYAHGGVLPEDIYGVGPSGQRYVLHADETVLPPNAFRTSVTGGVPSAGGTYITNYITVDARPHGSVITSQDLNRYIRDGLLALQGRNVTTGLRAS